MENSQITISPQDAIGQISVIANNGDYFAYQKYNKDGFTYNIYLQNIKTGSSKVVLTHDQFTSIDSVKISRDGQSISFLGSIPRQESDFDQVYTVNSNTKVVQLASINTAGEASAGQNGAALISKEGNLVFFNSTATNLSTNKTNYNQDIFIRDSYNGTTRSITSDIFDQGLSGGSVLDAISDDGRFVLFHSYNLQMVDLGFKVGDLLLKDLETGSLQLVSTADTRSFSNDFAKNPYTVTGGSISADGRYISFSYNFSDFSDANGACTIVKDMQLGTHQIASSSVFGVPNNRTSSPGQLSTDGQYVVFTSYGTNLSTLGSSQNSQIYIKDLFSGSISLVSKSIENSNSNGNIGNFSISSDKRTITFISSADDLVSSEVIGDYHLYFSGIPNAMNNDGDNTIYAYTFNCTVSGGLGNDTYTITSENQKIIESPDSGIDTVLANFSYQLPSNVENFTNTAPAGGMVSQALKLTGNLLNNKISSLNQKSLIDSGAGNDEITTGLGSDTIDAGAGDDKISSAFSINNGKSQSDFIYGRDGNDYISSGTGSDTIYGGNGNDTIRSVDYESSGTSDLIFGDDGDDSILSGGAGDTIYGGSGNDTINGNNGRGNGGEDLIYGDDGNDSISTGAGSDTIYGGSGNDTIASNTGSSSGAPDVIFGGDGNDEIRTGLSADSIDGGDGDDYIFSYNFGSFTAKVGNDTVNGGAGNDSISVGAGDDIVDGGIGSDKINNSGGKDVIYGGIGNDSIFSGLSEATIDGGIGDDTISSLNSKDVIYGGIGNDNITVQQGQCTINAGVGDDSILAGIGTDYIDAGDGNDTINSYAISYHEIHGKDTIYGGAGDDNIITGHGNILVDGGAGNDKITASKGNDTISTGSGNDSVIAGEGNDVIKIMSGNHTLNGGLGIDLLQLSESHEHYKITKTAQGFSIQELDYGTLSIASNIEKIQFSDSIRELASNDLLAKAYRIYQAAFNRTPDTGGLGYWYKQIQNGASLDAIALGFMQANEFTAMYGAAPSNTSLVNNFYQNVLHRAPDAGGLKYWVNLLDNKSLSSAQVLASFSESSENKAALVGVISNGIDYTPFG